MIFVDTNYFLRFLLSGGKEQHKEAKELFKKGATGKVKLFTSLIVFFEIYWVLFSFYKKDKNEVQRILSDVLKMDFVEFPERQILIESVSIMDKYNSDLEDAYNIVFSLKQKAKDFKTFDKDLRKKFQLFSADFLLR